MPVTLESRIPEIVVKAGKNAEAAVSRTCMEIEAGAKRKLVEHGSVVSGNLVGSVEAHVEGYEGDVGTAVEYGPFVEFGTGRRGAASDFPGKPAGLTYSVDGRWESRDYSVGDLGGGGTFTERFFNENWAGMTARPYLTPSAEEARAAFEQRAGKIFP